MAIVGLILFSVTVTTLYVVQSIDKNNLESELKVAKKVIWQLNDEVDYYRIRYTFFKNRSTPTPVSNSSSKASKEMIEAVKVAMKASHPDNGGKAEDFIKFRKLYSSLTGGKR